MKRRLVQAGVLLLAVALLCSLVLAEKCRDRKKGLPAQVMKSLTEKYPDATIKEIEKEEKEIKLFEVELALEDGSEIDVVMTFDGTVMEVENEMEIADLPFDVSTIIPDGAEVKEVESKITHAVMAPVALEKPETTYELEVMIDGKEVEYKIAPNGKVLGCGNEDRHDDDDDDDNGDDDDDDNGNNDDDD